jgi:hypothetical protein
VVEDGSGGPAASIEIIQQLYDQYGKDEYMQKRITHFFKVQIKPMFENMYQSYLSRQTHAVEMTIEQENFIQTFIHKYKYYYVGSTDKYIKYDEINYTCVSEDDVIHHVLSEISRDRVLMSWKQRTKTMAMRRIRETPLSRTIPNSETIQKILEIFHPFIFATKTEVKYFLAVMGDNLLKKQQHLIHLIPSKTKSFIRELNNYSQIYIGTNVSTTIKYKYHEHDYENCRILNMLNNVKSDLPWLKHYVLDIFCVAMHYSTRYGSADLFLLERNMDKELENKIFFLHNHTQEEIVEQFLNEFISPPAVAAAASPTISWKTMQYLWKYFLETHRLPAIIFQSSLKPLLIQKWQESSHVYDESTDVFVGAFSKYVPSIQKFLTFWNEKMVYDVAEYDLEIDEIAMLFRMDCRNKSELANVSDKQILDLILYFFPQVEIENEKYVQKWRCQLWDKSADIEMVLSTIRADTSSFLTMTPSPSCSSPMLTSIHDLYEKYCQNKYTEHLPVVSKQYFEKYIIDNLGDHVVDGQFISMTI